MGSIGASLRDDAEAVAGGLQPTSALTRATRMLARKQTHQKQAAQHEGDNGDNDHHRDDNQRVPKVNLGI